MIPTHSAAVDRNESVGLRKLVNQYGPIMFAVIVVLTGILMYRNLRNPYHPKAYYTVDDGKTFFVDDLQIPPIQHHGQEAVRAMVFTCEDGQKKFVGYLVRFTPEAKPKAEAAMRAGQPASNDGMQVKRPGDGEWVEAFDPRKLNAQNARKMILGGGSKKFDEVIKVKCPEGGKLAVMTNPE